ncbi:hypothetical protein Busp01_09590 [Trinickia caryophylli]|nr:hypothetical protein Busp01_09590 [Trinickia caryophylli]
MRIRPVANMWVPPEIRGKPRVPPAAVWRFAATPTFGRARSGDNAGAGGCTRRFAAQPRLTQINEGVRKRLTLT